jgi:aminoglycoside phosphotransferase
MRASGLLPALLIGKTWSLGSAAVLDWRVSSEGACLVTRTVAGVPASDLSASDLLKAWPSIADPDDGRLGFYLRLDPLTWG